MIVIYLRLVLPLTSSGTSHPFDKSNLKPTPREVCKISLGGSFIVNLSKGWDTALHMGKDLAVALPTLPAGLTQLFDWAVFPFGKNRLCSHLLRGQPLLDGRYPLPVANVKRWPRTNTQT